MVIIEERMDKSDLMENYLNYNLCGKFISAGN
ncbi:AraC family transcriptional regulator, partial [Clostridium beijerinckii]|nr:AraC family transcriptional regulator [Clostridium beijerinckii]